MSAGHDTRLLKTAAQLFNRMTSGADKLQADFFLRSEDEQGLSTMRNDRGFKGELQGAELGATVRDNRIENGIC